MRWHEHRVAWIFAACFAITLLPGGCASIGGLASNPQVQAQYDRAETLYRHGDFARAAAQFAAVAGQDRALRERALLRGAEAWRAQGKLDRAETLFAEVNRRRLGDSDQSRYDVLAAEIALHKRDLAQALALTSAPPQGLPADLRARELDVRARAQQAGGDAFAAARTRAQLDPLLSGEDRLQNQQRAQDLLASLGKDKLKAHYDTLADNDALKPFARRALEALGIILPRTLPQLVHPVGTVLGPGEREGYHMPARVALLLPESGALATPGAAVREGFFTAYFDAAHADDLPRPQVTVYDSGSTPEQAMAAYKQAVTDGAALVIGPLGRDTVAAMFAQPELPVPLLALNHPDNDLAPPHGSTEFGLLPEAEGAELAAHLDDRGIHGALVFLFDDDRAKRAAAAFQAQFESLGGKVLSQTVLATGSIDFATDINSALAAAGSTITTGIVILMRPQQARLVLPQLQLAGAKQPVFATSLVYAGSDDPTQDRDLDGVEFCDAPWLFDAQPGLPNHAAIAAQLPAARGAAARLFAFGMDAYALMPYLDWLRTHPGSYLPGATGQLAADARGHVNRVPVWARFDDGIARTLAAGLDTAPPAPNAASQ